MTANDKTGVQITGAAPLYSKPQPLTVQDHGKLGLLKSDNPYAIANKQHFVPLLVNEFGAAACNFPVVFAGEERQPIAIMGLSPGENLFIGDPDGRESYYIPAYIRRYPFTVANAENDQDQRAIICIDVDSPLIGENPDSPFFTEDGKHTDYTERCIEFCKNFERERMMTQQVIDRMKELDIFEPRNAYFRPTNPDGSQGEPQTVANFFAVSMDKLNALPVDTYIELRNLGILSAIHAHWMSQWHWDRLINMTFVRRGKADAEKANGAAKPAAKKKS